jgi:hypothetical protein
MRNNDDIKALFATKSPKGTVTGRISSKDDQYDTILTDWQAKTPKSTENTVKTAQWDVNTNRFGEFKEISPYGGPMERTVSVPNPNTAFKNKQQRKRLKSILESLPEEVEEVGDEWHEEDFSIEW